MEKLEPGEIVKRLTGFIRAEGHFKNVSVENFQKMPGGASREIWSFDCAIDDGATAYEYGDRLERSPRRIPLATELSRPFRT